MPGAFWCIVEDDRQGRPKKVTAELLGEARRWAPELGAGVEAVWLTDKAEADGLRQLAGWGADRVWLWEDPSLAPYRGEVWTAAVADLAAREAPRAVWGAVTSRQRELLAFRLAARLGIGLAADCVGFGLADGQLIATRPIYAGKLLAKVRWRGTPWLATLRPNVFKAADEQAGRTPTVERPALAPPAATTFVERREEARTGLPELTEADIVVSGGRGLKGPENSPCWRTSPRSSARRWGPRGRRSTPAGGRTASRSARRGGPSPPSSTSAAASRGPSSTWPGCGPRR
jgi:electron transfer flavoprotein alpha subunit